MIARGQYSSSLKMNIKIYIDDNDGAILPIDRKSWQSCVLWCMITESYALWYKPCHSQLNK